MLPVRIVVALALGLATLPFLAGAASAAVTSIVNDGDQDGATNDWEGLAGLPADPNFQLIADPVGNADTTTFSNSESDYPDWEAGSDGTASGKSDIGNVYVYDYRDGDQHVNVALAWDRAGDTGTGRYYVELNQQPNQGLVPVRTVGDRRITIGINGSDDLVCQRIEVWDGDSWGDADDCSAIPVNVNPDPIDDYFDSPNDDPTGTLVGNTFVETVIDLTDFGATSCPVSGYQSLSVRSQEGNENGDTSALKDRATGNVTIDSDCATIKIVKKDSVTGLPVTVAGAKFSVTPDPTAGSSDTGSKTVVDNNTSAADLTDSDPAVGKITITEVDPNTTYTVRELVAPSGYHLPPPAPDYSDCPTSGDYDCLKQTAGPGGTITFTFSDKLIWAAPTISKLASGTVATRYTWEIEKTVSNTEDDADATDFATQNQAPGSAATFHYDIKVTGTEHKGAYAVTGKVTVKNSNPGAMVVTLSDSLHDGTVCTFDGTDHDGAAAGFQANVPSNLPDGTDYAYSCAPTADPPVAGDNTARVTWSTNRYPQTDAQAWATSPGTDFREATDGYTYDATGNTDKSVSVSDTYAELNGPRTVTYDASNLDQQGKYVRTFAYSHAFSGDPAGTCTSHVNTAKVSVLQTAPDPATLAQDSATAEVCVGADLTVTKNKVVSLKRTYAFSIDKSVEDSSVEVDPETGKATADYTVVVTDGKATDSDWAMSGEITVDNPNDWAVTLSSITDSYEGTVCTVSQGADLVIGADNPQTEVDEGKRVFAYTCTFTSKPPYNGTNTATVTWDEAVAATASDTASGTAAVVGADWTLAKVNESVHVVDDKTVEGASNALGTVIWLAEGTEHTFTYSLELEGLPGQCVDHDNTATITETGANSSVTVTVCYPVDPTVDKTAGGTYDRTYLWEITKEADQTLVETDGVDGAEVGYTVTAKPNGYTDDGWTMNGTITVSNPNDFKSMTVDITDVPNVGPGATCTVTDGDDVVVPAGTLVEDVVVPGTASRDYICTVPEQPLYEGGTNTAVVAWDGGAASSEPEPVVFALAGETDKTVTVVDDQTVPGEEVELGQATWNDLGDPTEFTYSLELEAAANECETYVNTAEIVETGQFDDATVEACGPEILPTEAHRPPVVKGVDTVLPSTGGPQLGLAWAGIGMLLTGAAMIASRRRGRFGS